MGREFIDILNREMVPAEGCTEPIAVAYAVSLAVDTLGETPKNIDILLSANVVKNALGVGIPGTGKVGIDIAAALGAIIKKPEKKLEILKGFSEEELKKANELISSKKIKVSQKDTKEKLYIEVIAKGENNNSKVIILKDHTNVVLIEKNGEMILDKEINDVSNENVSKSSDLTIKSMD